MTTLQEREQEKQEEEEEKEPLEPQIVKNRTRTLVAVLVIGFFVLSGAVFSMVKLYISHQKSENATVAEVDLTIATPRIPTVEGVSDLREKTPSSNEPVSFESHSRAIEVLPIRKEGVRDLVVPTAHASVVMDVDSGVVLEENDAHERRQIASLTKLMTAILVVEQIKDLNEVVTIDEEAIYSEGTRVGCPRSGYCNGERLHVGEKLTVHDLLKAMLMNSANDSAVALGKHISGSQEEFAELMNVRAHALGLQNTHFCTPSGLELDGRESECYSSAFDIARIAAQSLKYDVIWQCARMPNTTITSIDGKYTHDIFNTDMLLDSYPELIGTKTGFTPLAGYSLLAVSYDSPRKHRVISVVLNDSARWQSVQQMFAWAFQSHYWR